MPEATVAEQVAEHLSPYLGPFNAGIAVKAFAPAQATASRSTTPPVVAGLGDVVSLLADGGARPARTWTKTLSFGRRPDVG